MTREERLLREKERTGGMYLEERRLSGDAAFCFGIDEAGRGPLCGPVVAACCLLPDEEILYLNDSKKLSEKKREELFFEITGKAVSYGIGMASEKRIDEINILNATFEAMAEAFQNCMDLYRRRIAEASGNRHGEELKKLFDHIPGLTDSIVLVDGNRTVPGIYLRQKAVIGGDAKCPSIAAASILAKVTRDRLMLEYDEKYPEYGFRANKGYGTKQHIAAIREYGPLDIHRKTFIKKFVKEEDPA